MLVIPRNAEMLKGENSIWKMRRNVRETRQNKDNFGKHRMRYGLDTELTMLERLITGWKREHHIETAWNGRPETSRWKMLGERRHIICIENAGNAEECREEKRGRGFDSCVKQSGSNPLLARCIIILVWRVMRDKVRLQFPLFPQLRGSKTKQNSASPAQAKSFPRISFYFEWPHLAGRRNAYWCCFKSM